MSELCPLVRRQAGWDLAHKRREGHSWDQELSTGPGTQAAILGHCCALPSTLRNS